MWQVFYNCTHNSLLPERKHGDWDDPLDAILYGPSTQNKIERWWRELLERMERFFKEQLTFLVESGDYDSSDQND